MKNKSMISLFVSLVLLSSCVNIGQVDIKDNKVDGKAEAKINTEVNASANIQTKIDTNIKTGDISIPSSNTTNQEKKDLNRFSELRVTNLSFYVSSGTEKSRLFDDDKKIQSVFFNKYGIKGNLNNYLELVYDDNGIKKSKDITFEYVKTIPDNNFILKSNGDFEVYGKGGGELTIKDTKNNIVKKVLLTSYDSDIEENNSKTKIPSPKINNLIDISNINTTRIIGTIYDKSNNAVQLADINLKLNNSIIKSTKTNNNGEYIFENIELDKTYFIEATKKGWTSSLRGLSTEAKLKDYKVDFISKYSIQDEPKIIEVKINDVDYSNSISEISQVFRINELKQNLKFEFTFSENVIKSSVENNYQIKLITNDKTNTWTFNKVLWLDNKKFQVIIPINELLAENSISYNDALSKPFSFELFFTNPFLDETNKSCDMNQNFEFTKSNSSNDRFYSIKTNKISISISKISS